MKRTFGGFPRRRIAYAGPNDWKQAGRCRRSGERIREPPSECHSDDIARRRRPVGGRYGRVRERDVVHRGSGGDSQAGLRAPLEAGPCGPGSCSAWRGWDSSHRRLWCRLAQSERSGIHRQAPGGLMDNRVLTAPHWAETPALDSCPAAAPGSTLNRGKAVADNPERGRLRLGTARELTVGRACVSFTSPLGIAAGSTPSPGSRNGRESLWTLSG